MKTNLVISAIAATLLVTAPLSSAYADGWGHRDVGLGLLGAAAIGATAAILASPPPAPVYAAPPVVYAAPPPVVYYAPPPVYAAPPAVIYAPPPVYYAAPGYYRRY